MDSINTDILVIGGSANGSQAAMTASADSVKTLVIEEHSQIGYPEHCSGLFSYEGLKQIDSFPPRSVILNHNVKGAYIYSPSLRLLEVKKSSPHAIVVDRAKFDQFLAQKAMKQGADYLLNHKAINILRKNNKWIIHVLDKKSGKNKKIISKMVIDAEGHRRTIAKRIGLVKKEKRVFVNAAQFYYKNVDNLNIEMVELFQTQKYAKGFFGWIIPINQDQAKIGLGTLELNAAKKLEKMVSEHFILKNKLENAYIYRKTAGRIPVDGPVKKTYTKGFLLIGDAAGQTKPTTGGGVILGGIASRIAGKIAAEAIKKQNYSEKFLRRYQKEWKRQIGKNLLVMRWVRNYLNNLSDNTVDELFEILLKDRVKSKIEKIGHVDQQIKIVLSLLLEPSLLPFYIKTSPQLLQALL